MFSRLEVVFFSICVCVPAFKKATDCETADLCFPSGSLCSSIFDPLSALVGASGGVYALIGGYFMNAVVVSLHTVY